MNCELCKNTGILSNQKLCSCRLQLCSKLRYIEANIPTVFLDVTFTTFYTKFKRDNLFLQSLLKSESSNFKHLCFLGPTQVGKTTAAAILAKHFIDLGATLYWWNYGELLNKLCWYKSDSKLIQFIENTLKFDVIILDDLGRGINLSDLAIAETERILQHRLERNQQLIITGNMIKSDISKIFGVKIQSLFDLYVKIILFAKNE